ncbi:MAG: protein kinase [Planctomycetaceae bacterium]
MNSPDLRVVSDIETTVEAFEDALHEGDRPRLEDFLPARDDPAYPAVLEELIRVDLEFRFANQEPASLDDYRDAFPEAFASPQQIAPIAFEEYRLRLHSANPAAPEEYAQKYGIDVADWPASVARTSRKSIRGGSHGPAGMPKCAVEMTAGQDVLNFRLVGELGRGAFARVFLAEQRALSDRLVVLKVSAARLREAERLAQLQHTNIVPVYSVDYLDDASVICMPYFGATTLRHLIEALSSDAARKADGHEFLSTVNALDDSTLAGFDLKRRLPTVTAGSAETDRGTARTDPASESPLNAMDFERSVAWIARQLSEGLAHAHARGILHRDLKPANVLLTEHGQPMILDFNLSVDSGPDRREDGMVGGTLPYMSPEQIAALDSFREIDGRSDVFSLGVVLFQLCTGRLPFSTTGVSSREMIEQRWTTQPHVREHVRSISADMESIILKCMQPDPDKRYATAADLTEDLDRHLAWLPLKHARNRSLRQRISKWRTRHPRLTSASSAAGVAGVGIAGILLAWSLREQTFLKTESRLKYNEFMDSLPGIRADAMAAALGEASDADAAPAIEAALQQFQPDSANSDWSKENAVQSLEPAEQVRLKRAVAELKLLRTAILEPESLAARLADDSTETAVSKEIADGELSESQWTQYLDAVAALMNRQPRRSLQIVAPLTPDRPDNFGLMLLQSLSQRAAGEYDQADRYLSVCIALRPETPQLYYQRGVCRMLLQKYSDAIHDFDRFLKLRPESSSAFFSRGVCFRKIQKHEESLADLDRAVELGFPETRIYLLRAEVHESLGHADLAKADRETAMSTAPTDPRSCAARAIYRLKDDPSAALADLELALQIDPRSHDAFRNKAMVLSEYLHEPRQAIDVLTEAMTAFPDDAYLWSGRGVLYARNNNRDEAVADAVDAMKKSTEPMVEYQVACIYALTSTQEPADQALCLRHLANSFRADPALGRLAATDTDLKAIQELPQFRNLLTATQILAAPNR